MEAPPESVFGSEPEDPMVRLTLLGLALGGLWVRSRLDGMKHPLRFAGYIQVLMGIRS